MSVGCTSLDVGGSSDGIKIPDDPLQRGPYAEDHSSV